MALDREVISDRDTIGHAAEIDLTYLPHMIAYKSALTELLLLDAGELANMAGNHKTRLDHLKVTNEINKAITWIEHAWTMQKTLTNIKQIEPK